MAKRRRNNDSISDNLSELLGYELEAQSFFRRAVAELDSGIVKKAYQTYQKALRIDLEHFSERSVLPNEHHLLLGFFLMKKGGSLGDKRKLAAAITSFEKLKNLEPSLWTPYKGLVEAYFFLENYEKAKEALLVILEFDDFDSIKKWAEKLHFTKEVAQRYKEIVHQYLFYTDAFTTEDYARAAEFQKNIIELEDINLVNYERLVFLLFRAGKIYETLFVLEQIIVLEPNNFKAHFTKASILHGYNANTNVVLGVLEETILLVETKEQIEEIISVFIENESTGRYLGIADSAYSILSSIELKSNNLEAALEAAKKALSFNEEKYETHAMVGKLYYYLEDYESACRFFDNAYELNKSNILIQFSKVVCLAKSGRVADAYVELPLIINNPEFNTKPEYAQYLKEVKNLLYNKLVELELAGIAELEGVSELRSALAQQVAIAKVDKDNTPASTIATTEISGLSHDSGSVRESPAHRLMPANNLIGLEAGILDQWFAEAKALNQLIGDFEG